MGADRQAVKVWANESPLVLTWRYDLPNTFYLVSEASAAELYADFAQGSRKSWRCLVTEVSENRQGRLPMDTWYFLRNKRSKPDKA